MKEKLIKSAGITLIALVITIIVLLILAGITISFVIGNNGIITQAQNAVTTNREAVAKEQVEMAWMACESAYYEAWSKDTSAKLEDYLTKEKLNAELSATGIITELEDNGNGKYFVKYQSYDQGIEYPFYMDNGMIVQPRIAELVTVNNYGDYIDYGIDLNDNQDTTDDWRIFYADEKGTYIITSDYLPVSKMPEGISKNASYGAYWTDEQLSSMQNLKIKREVTDVFKFNWFDDEASRLESSEIGCCKGKVMAILLDADRWQYLVSDEIKKMGGMAIGAPTTEMWVNSWNAKGENNGTLYPHIYLESSSAGNYYLGRYWVAGNSSGSGYAGHPGSCEGPDSENCASSFADFSDIDNLDSLFFKASTEVKGYRLVGDSGAVGQRY